MPPERHASISVFPSDRRASLAGLAASLALHAALFVYIQATSSGPDLGFEFELPAEIEFGAAEATVIATAPVVPPPPPVAPPSTESPGGPAAGASPDGGVAEDAGRRRRRDAGNEGDGGDVEGGAPTDADDDDAGAYDGGLLVAASEVDAGVEVPGTPGAVATTTTLPPGAQLAVRMDMARIRRSTLAEEVRRLLGAIPDWRAVLEGSDIAPLDDLDRIMIASPNLERSRMVFAGRYEGDPARVREIVARMAAARGVDAPWHMESGVPVATWPNVDETPRVVALVGPRHFAICRPEDLVRVIAFSEVRADREQHEGEPPESNADALLSMAEDDVLTFEVEGAQAFVRGDPQYIPARLRLQVKDAVRARVAIDAEGVFPTEEAAEAARDFWDSVRGEYARNFWVTALGMGSALEDAELTVEGNVVRAHTTLTLAQIRFMLAYVEGLFGRPRTPRAGTGTTSAPPPSRDGPPPPPSTMR